MSDSLNLFRLQKLDTRLTQIESRQKSIADALESNAQLREAKVNLEAAASWKQNIASDLNNKHFDAGEKKIKIAQIESSLYGGSIQSPKELKGLQDELDSLKRYLAAIEDQELEDMIALDNAHNDFTIALGQYEVIFDRVALENSDRIKEQEILLKEFERLMVERQATMQSIEQKNLALYNEIREQRHGIAVTTISDNSCDSCGAVLTPAQQQSAHHSHQLFRCPSCGRFIYS